jgi:hypothetical protein
MNLDIANLNHLPKRMARATGAVWPVNWYAAGGEGLDP